MTPDQELEKLRNEQAEAKRRARQYENRVKLLLNEVHEKERCARTRCLIQHGAILESVFPVKDMDGEEIRALLTQISSPFLIQV